MSLIPYHPQEGREIVLRHRNAIVVHDPTSQRLEIRGVAECPTCHRPLRSASPERPHFGDDSHHNSNSSGGHHGYSRREGYVDPNYFRLLRAGHHVGQLRASPAPSSPPSVSGGRSSSAAAVSSASRAGRSSPLRRLFQPLVGRADADTDADSVSSVDGVDSNDAFDPDAGSPTAASTSLPHDVPHDAEFVSSTPYVPPDASNPINKQAFSPNYFRTFFVEERELGRGGKGVVLLVRHEIDGCQLGYFACKRVPVGDDHAWLEKVLVEVELLAKLSHPNLVSYRHVWLENVTLNRFGPSVACAFILQQYCNGGDLHRYIIGDQPKEATKEELKARMRRLSKGQAERPQDLYGSYRHLAFDEIYSLFKDITSGLAYLHAANYIHRDLKPSNCLLHREGRIITCLISDFGEVQAENVARKSTGTTGTISYCAPEVLRQDPGTGLYGNFTTKSDVFSLGMILYFLCFGRLPYRSANAVNEELEDVTALRAEISHWKGFSYERRERPDLPTALYHLLTKMLSVNPAERPSANDVLVLMRSDSGGLDGFGMGTRSGSSSSANMAPPVGISGRRIQNLDSPMPSTPVPDPTKSGNPLDGSPSSSQRVEDLDETAIDDSDDLPSPFLRSSVRNGFSSGNHRTSTSLTLTRSRGSQASHAGRSPERGGHPMITRSADLVGGHQDESATQTSPILSPRRRTKRQQLGDGTDGNSIEDRGRGHGDDARDRRHSTSPLLDRHANHGSSSVVPQSPYLLMPPPQSAWGEARYHAVMFLQRNVDTVAFVLRTVLFLVKMASLTKPCWPFTVRFGVGSSLLLLAALDLGVPRAEDTSSTRTFISYPTHTRPATHSWRLRWDWRMSLFMFVLHFVVLALASRTEVLCSAGVGGGSQETWDAWDGVEQ